MYTRPRRKEETKFPLMCFTQIVHKRRGSRRREKKTNICIFLDPSSGIRETNGPSPGRPGAHFPFQLLQKPINFTSLTFSPPLLRLKAWTSQKQGTKTSFFTSQFSPPTPHTMAGPKREKTSEFPPTNSKKVGVGQEKDENERGMGGEKEKRKLYSNRFLPIPPPRRPQSFCRIKLTQFFFFPPSPPPRLDSLSAAFTFPSPFSPKIVCLLR